VNQKPGWSVTEGRVYVKDSAGNVRVYDGVAHSPSGKNIGLEVKSGTATKTGPQKVFDTNVDNKIETAIGTGKNKGLIIDRTIEIRRK
jgi:hypothetical protein